MVRDRPTQGDLRRRADRRALAVSLLLSVFLHLLAFQINFEPKRQQPQSDGEHDQVRPLLDVIRVLELALPQEPPPVPDIKVDVIAPIVDIAPPWIKVEEDELRGATTDPRSDTPVGPALGPRMIDLRLWGPITAPSETGPLPGVQLRSRFDSLKKETAGGRVPVAGDMSAWMTRDADGNRWGFSPGLIHFGNVALPLCYATFDASNCGFGVPPSFREEYRNQLRALLEILRQGNRADLEERARAIRSRLDAARDSIPPP